MSEPPLRRVQVFGTGCANCRRTVQLIETAASASGVPIALTKVESIEDIVAAGVMSTPAVAVDGRIVHAGGIPSREAIAAWLGLG